MSEQSKPFRVTDRRSVTADEVRPETEPATSPPETPSGADAPAADEPATEHMDFGSFVLSLAAQAGTQLETKDLKGARTIIGILEMLKDKTEGRRTPDEERLLESLLYQLRMSYLARVGVVGT